MPREPESRSCVFLCNGLVEIDCDDPKFMPLASNVTSKSQSTLGYTSTAGA